MKTIITIAVSLLISGCGGINNTKQMNTLPDVVQVGHNVLSRDTIPSFNYPTITEDQRMKVRLKSFTDLPDSTKFIGVREIGGKRTLEAYMVPLSEDPNNFEVYLITRGSDGWGIHCIDLGRFHTCEYQGRPRLGGNRYYTTDATLHFDNDSHFTLHRVMTLTSLYLKDHRLTEMWRVEWDDQYEIDSNGYFIYKRQQETLRTPADLDDPMITDYQARDL